jgi:hypothetical protein
MTIKTTLAALLLSACTIPGLTTGSTVSTSSSSSSPTSTPPAPPPVTAPAPVAAASPPATDRADAPSAAPTAGPRPLEQRDVESIDHAASLVASINAGETKPGDGSREDNMRDFAMYCSQSVENLISRDYPRSTRLPLKHADATLGEADAKICQPLAKLADGWGDRAKAAYAAQNDALLEPYRKVGVSGDKLKLVSDLGVALICPGQADPTPARVAKASVLFSLRHDGFRQWTIVRYAFKGNAQVAVTEKGYADRPGPDQYR